MTAPSPCPPAPWSPRPSRSPAQVTADRSPANRGVRSAAWASASNAASPSMAANIAGVARWSVRRAWRCALMFDVVVAGAGPAGLAAARRAAESGAHVAMIDDNPRPGGQIWRAGIHGLSPDAAAWLSNAVTRIDGERVVAAPEPGRLTLEN